MARIENVQVPVRRRDATLSLVFETADGATVRPRTRADRSLGKHARDDVSFVEVQVRYLPEDSSVIRLAGQRTTRQWRRLLAAALAVGALAPAVLRLRQPRG